MTKRPPKDTNQLAKYILEVTTGETEKIEPPVKKEQKHSERGSELARTPPSSRKPMKHH